MVKELSHPNIVQYISFDDTDPDWCYIVMELCRCSLKERLDLLPDIWEAANQLTCALDFMHGCGFAHR